VAALLAASTLLWMVAMMTAPEEALAMLAAPRVSEVLPMFMKTSVSIIFNSRFGFDPVIRLCSHNVYSQYRNSLSSWVLVLESLSSPLEEQSEEVERLQVSWLSGGCPGR